MLANASSVGKLMKVGVPRVGTTLGTRKELAPTLKAFANLAA
jgi:hypothetical protein